MISRVFVGGLALVTLLSVTTANVDVIDDGLVNAKVDRAIDLATHLPRITNKITLENKGKSAAKFFLYAIDSELSSGLSFIGATVKVGDEEKKLTITETTVAAKKDSTFYRVTLLNSLEPGQQVTVQVVTVHPHTLRPYPAQIAQSDKQLVLFQGNVFYYSPYSTTTQTTTVTCASKNLETYTKLKPVTNNEAVIVYGPYDNRPAFSLEELEIHFENNSPFLTVTSLTRVIEVSHWGNIAVEETVDLRHTGALLKGSFSRFDYQRQQDQLSSIRSFKTILPASSKDVYYRDEIGNISTSHLRETDDVIELEIRPRFPLFGGWKTHYVIGYNVPSYQYLFNKGEQYLLKMRFLDHIYDDQVIDEMTVKVILPERSEDLKFWAPYAVRRGQDEKHYTYLDTTGRPVIVAYRSNSVEDHVDDFELAYKYRKASMLWEPCLVVAAFYLLFLLVIVYVRLDFAITKDEASESRLRVAGLLEQVQSAQDRRSALYQSYEDSINKYKASKDLATFTSSRKRIDTDHKQLTQAIGSLATKLKTEGSDASEKVNELQRLDSQVREQLNLLAQSAEKLVGGKQTKQQYLDIEGGIKTKRDEFVQKMDNLLASLGSL